MAFAVEREEVLDHPHQAIDFDTHAGFLAHLSYHRGVGELTDFYVAAGQEPGRELLDADQ